MVPYKAGASHTGCCAHAQSRPEPIFIYTLRIAHADLWSGLAQVSCFAVPVSLHQTNNPRSVCLFLDMLRIWARGQGWSELVKTQNVTFTSMLRKHTWGGQSEWEGDRWKVSGWIRVLVVILGDMFVIWLWVVTGQWGVGMPCVTVCWKQLSELPQWRLGVAIFW